MTPGLRIALVVAAAVALLFSRMLMFPTNALLFLILVALLWRPADRSDGHRTGDLDVGREG